MSLLPVTLPYAAGLQYAAGDVQHLTPEDPNSSMAISRSTRQLAYRDTMLAQKVNELVTEVNNTEKIVSVDVPRSKIGALGTLVAANFRIPEGYEARVLNAIINSSPATGRLEVLYSSGFGSTTGTAIVTTQAEMTGQSVFYGTGEFVVKVVNTGGTPIELVANVLVTMRASGEIMGAILAPTTFLAADGGESGFSGWSGSSGASGFSGARGASGFSGYSGRSGFSGFSGLNGYSGYSGARGYSGYTGVTGVSGFSGYSGFSGAPATSAIGQLLFMSMNELRANTDYVHGFVYRVYDTGMVLSAWFDDGSTETDDGSTYVKPDDINVLDPGRYVIA